MIDLCFVVTCDWCGCESHISKLLPMNKNLKDTGAKKKYQSSGWIFKATGLLNRDERVFCSEECQELFNNENNIHK